MRRAMWMVPAWLLAGSAALVGTAQAKTVPIVGKDNVEGRCHEAGGTFETSSHTGSYSCLHPDGSGISCGGWTKAQKKTCDTWGAEAKVEEQPSRESGDRAREGHGEAGAVGLERRRAATPAVRPGPAARREGSMQSWPPCRVVQLEERAGLLDAVIRVPGAGELADLEDLAGVVC